MFPSSGLPSIDVHRVCVGGEGKYRAPPPSPPPEANFKTLFNKNIIKPEIGGPLLAIFLENLDPLGILAKISDPPFIGFSNRVHLCCQDLCLDERIFKTRK